MLTETKPAGSAEEEKKYLISGAETVVKCLLEEGTQLVFGYPGGAIMPVYDALYQYQNVLRHVLVRHEQGAVHAAQGYARATGKTGVCIATSGPGATNLITGLADAMADNTPIVCITGQVPSRLLGSDAFQETDVIGLTVAATKWNIQVTSASDIPAAIAKAFYIARSGRPGPVLVDITKDAQFEKADFRYEKCRGMRSYVPYPTVDLTKVQKAAALINSAKRPLALIGQGVSLAGAEEELNGFLSKTGMPAATTLLGLSSLETGHPQNMGMLGMHGNYAPNLLTNYCDVLVAIGMRFDDRVTGDVSRYAKQARIVHLEIDPSEINKIVKCDAPVLGDCKESLRLLNLMVNPNSHSAWIEEFRKLQQVEYHEVMEKDLFPESDALSMGEVLQGLNEQKPEGTILVTDVGQHQMVASRYFRFDSRRSNITSGGLGTMGFALPAALGARMGSGNREVVAVIGDGGLQMTLQELATVAQEKVPVKIVLLNNNFLGMVRQWQELFFDRRYSQTEMVNPDFQGLCRGFGIASVKVEARKDLRPALEELFRQKGPFLLEVVVAKEENVFPMIPAGAAVDEVRLS